MENDSTFARTRRDEGGIEPPVLSYILQRPIRSIQYCEYVLYRMLSYRTQELPLGSASPVLGVMREGLNHLCFPAYYRGPFVASNIANLPLDLRSILAMIVPVVVGPLAGHANSLSAPLQRPIRSASKYCESTTHPVYHAKITVSTKNFPRSEGRKCGVKGLDQWRGLMVWSRSWFRTTGVEKG